MKLITEDKPAWDDKCQHTMQSYLGTIKDIDSDQVVDVYIFNGDQLCVRHGNKQVEYFGGTLQTFLASLTEQRGFWWAKKVFELMTREGKIIWTRR